MAHDPSRGRSVVYKQMCGAHGSNARFRELCQRGAARPDPLHVAASSPGPTAATAYRVAKGAKPSAGNLRDASMACSHKQKQPVRQIRAALSTHPRQQTQSARCSARTRLAHDWRRPCRSRAAAAWNAPLYAPSASAANHWLCSRTCAAVRPLRRPRGARGRRPSRDPGRPGEMTSVRATLRLGLVEISSDLGR